jgi:hypothetical protein
MDVRLARSCGANKNARAPRDDRRHGGRWETAGSSRTREENGRFAGRSIGALESEEERSAAMPRGDMSREEYVVHQRRLVASIAQKVLDGELGVIEGAREIIGLDGIALPVDDQDLMRMVAVDSETDALPLGRVRELWAPEVLERKDEEIRRAEEWARGFAWEAFRRLVERFRDI